MDAAKTDSEGKHGLEYPSIVDGTKGIEVQLPGWVDEILFDNLGANHNPARSKRSFDRNLDSSKEEVLTYLGTYFPRSLAESFVIFDSLLSDKNYAALFAKNDTIRICSVGSGTGGDLLGLVLALDSRLHIPLHLEVLSVEGNREAHSVMAEVFDRAKAHFRLDYSIKYVNYVFSSPDPFVSFDREVMSNQNEFDFIITSKMLNELDGAQVSQRPYFEFCREFLNRISARGTLLVLDITSPNGACGKWTPVQLNGQINNLLASCSSFKTILPLLCNRFESECGRECYTQNAIRVSYRDVSNECSKICYRVIGAKELVDSLSSSTALWNCPVTKNNMNHCGEFHGSD